MCDVGGSERVRSAAGGEQIPSLFDIIFQGICLSFHLGLYFNPTMSAYSIRYQIQI
jgi:hypothetical protein